MPYNWLYNSSNDNIYIMLLIIIILGFIILDFDLLKRKKDKFDDTTSSQDSNNTDDTNNTNNTTTTKFQPAVLSNPSHNLFIEPNNLASWKKAWVQLDGNQDTIPIITDSNGIQITNTNDITQSQSDLYNTTNNSNINAFNYSTIGDYATLDSLGDSLTDTLGGINTNLGYTIIQEQLGTFTPPTNNNPFTYDNTANYKTGMNPNTIDGLSSGSISGQGRGFSAKLLQDNKPVFLQKDFEGVANIFAPNIIIANAPLTNDGIPDISFQI